MSLKERIKNNFESRDKGTGGAWILDFSKFDDVKFFNPKEGRNAIDILPYKVSSEHHPAGLKPGEEDYLLDVWIHRNVGQAESTVLCLKKTFSKACPICEEMILLRQGEQNEEVTRQLRPTRRCIYNIIDMNHQDDGIQIFSVSHFLFEKELLEESVSDDGEVVSFPDLSDGRTIRFKAIEDFIGKQAFTKFKSFSFEKREPYDESTFDAVYPLDAMLVIPTYDEIKKLLYGGSEDEEHSKAAPAKESKEPEAQRKRLVRGVSAKKEALHEETKTPAAAGARERVQSKNKCSFGHEFGKDCDKFDDDCSQCNVWEDCAHEYDQAKSKQ